MKWKEAEHRLGISDLKERLGNKIFSDSAILQDAAKKEEPSTEDIKQIAHTCFMMLPTDKNHEYHLNRFFRVWSLETVKEEFTDTPENQPPFYQDQKEIWHRTFENRKPAGSSPKSLLANPRKWIENHKIQKIPHFVVGKERAGNFYDRNTILRAALKSRRLHDFVKKRLFPVTLLYTDPDSEKLMQACFQSMGIEIFRDQDDSHGFIWYEDYASLPMLTFITPYEKKVSFPENKLLEVENQEDRIRVYSQSSFLRAGNRAFRQLESQYQSLKEWNKNLEGQLYNANPASEEYKKLRSLFGFSARIDTAQNRELLYDIPDILASGGSECFFKEIKYLDLEMGLIARKKAYCQQILQLRNILQFRMGKHTLYRPFGQSRQTILTIPAIIVCMETGKILIQEGIEITVP